MTDKFSTAKRKIIMQAVKGKNSKPEKIIRSLIFKLGFRYRLHDSSLPGKPDLVFRAAKKAVFIHGCYWHRHNCKKGDSTPSVNQDFWEKKFDNNRKRDKKVQQELKKMGWTTLVIWECQIKQANRNCLIKRITHFLTD
ncbi:MAG: very short patch repair endonuclease [Candidatus Rifleibacteriota bacterium]